MGYIYDSLKTALGGNKMSSKNAVISDWTPNGVRCLVISRNYIFVGYHVQMPKIVPLNIEEVQKELEKHSSQGALHNLLTQRKLSCLEEIYVDSMFQNYKYLMDMELFISKHKSSDNLRLRYYGYCECPNGSEQYLQKKYSGMLVNPDYLYCLATDRERVNTIKIQATPTDYKTWYKEYNLRPQYYKLDGEQGRLAIYFKKGADVIEGLIASQESAKNEMAMEAVIKKIIEVDKANLKYVESLLKFSKSLMVVPMVDEARIREVRKFISSSFSPRRGLTKEIAQKYADKTLQKRYVQVNLVQKVKDAEPLTPEMVQEENYLEDGFFQIRRIAEETALIFATDKRETQRMGAKITYLFCEGTRPIPDGKLRSIFTNEPSTCKDALYNLFEYLCRMNGYGFEEIDEQAKRGMK